MNPPLKALSREQTMVSPICTCLTPAFTTSSFLPFSAQKLKIQTFSPPQFGSQFGRVVWSLPLVVYQGQIPKFEKISNGNILLGENAVANLWHRLAILALDY